MALPRYEPWNTLQKLQEDLARMYDEARVGRSAESDGSSVVTSHWVPAVDIREEADRYVLLADIPGVDPKGIEITTEAGMLIIKGERKRPDAATEDNYSRVERVYGTFYRRFSLPDTANLDGIAARGENGVLEISIPKQEKMQPRRIEVG